MQDILDGCIGCIHFERNAFQNRCFCNHEDLMKPDLENEYKTPDWCPIIQVLSKELRKRTL